MLAQRVYLFAQTLKVSRLEQKGSFGGRNTVVTQDEGKNTSGA